MKEDAIKLDEKKSKDWKNLFDNEVERFIRIYQTLSTAERQAIIKKGIQRKLSEAYNTASKKLEGIKANRLYLNIKVVKVKTVELSQAKEIRSVESNNKKFYKLLVTLFKRDKATVIFLNIIKQERMERKKLENK